MPHKVSIPQYKKRIKIDPNYRTYNLMNLPDDLFRLMVARAKSSDARVRKLIKRKSRKSELQSQKKNEK